MLKSRSKQTIRDEQDFENEIKLEENPEGRGRRFN